VDDGVIHYKLNFLHYSIERDFFSYRLISPSAVSDLLHFEITYLPGSNTVNLRNRTLAVQEGASQPITNSTLWLETPDDKNFRFTVTIPPFHGVLALASEAGGKFYLTGLGASFTSSDIANRRLVYEHSGDESRSDSLLFLAESLYEKPNGDGAASIPLWYSINILADNDHSPRLLSPTFETHGNSLPSHVILLSNGRNEVVERTLHSSLFPWFDEDDNLNGANVVTSPPTNLSFHFPDVYRDFTITRRDSPDVSIHDFTTAELNSGSLIIRYLSAKSQTSARYSVSDGNHSVNSTLVLKTISATIIEFSSNQITVPTGSGLNRLLLVTSYHLLATTSMDLDPQEVSGVR